MSYKNYEWEVIAKDYNSPLSRNYFWVQSWFEQARLLNIPRIILGIYSKGNIMEYILDKGFGSWMDTHNAFKEQVLKDYTLLERHIDATTNKGDEMNEWTEKNLFERDLSVLSDTELFELEMAGLEKISTVYAYGTILPILDFQGFSFVEGNLEQILKKYVEAEYQKWYEIFTAPYRNSFSQDQEIDLLHLYQRFVGESHWKEDVKSKSWVELQLLSPQFARALEEHTKKHAWVYYVYAGPAFAVEQFYEFIQQYAQQAIDPMQKLNEIQERKKHIETEKEKFLSMYPITEFERALLLLAGKVVWAKPRRKDYQSKSYYHIEKVQKEIGKRFGMTLKQVRACPLEYLKKMIEGEDVDHNVPNLVAEEHVCLPNDDGTVSILYGKEAMDFATKIIRKEESVEENVKEVHGTCACPGKGSGVVRIINIASDMYKMNLGDVLVSTATTPSIIAAMKKASAIVTDEGGLTCHAAIVSRELNIPCVIGVKVATAVLKDGDVVEVDATQGVIKIIS